MGGDRGIVRRVRLHTASLNLAGTACVSLEKIFPGPHPDLEGPGAAKRYFETLHEAAGE